MSLFNRDHQSGSDDIDATLNAFWRDPSHEPDSEIAAQALHTQRMAMSAIRSDLAATGPAAGTWNRVLRATAQPTSKGREEMINSSWPAWDQTAPPQRNSRSVKPTSPFTGAVATLAIVAILAFGGWFAAVNLPSGQNNRHLGMISATPVLVDDCITPALTVEEAIVILRNPFHVYSPADGFRSASVFETLSAEETAKPTRPQLNHLLTDSPRNDITQNEWEDILTVGNQFLSCMRYGTVGQVLALTDPVIVQHYLLDQLPTFVSEDEARALLIDILTADATPFGWADSDQRRFVSDKTLEINPDFGLIYADAMTMYRNAFYTDIVGAPVLFLNSDGTLANDPNFAGLPVTGQDRVSRYARNVFFVRSAFDGRWYVFEMATPYFSSP